MGDWQAFSFNKQLSKSACRDQVKMMMSLLNGISKNMSCQKATAPGDKLFKEWLTVQPEVCMAVARACLG